MITTTHQVGDVYFLEYAQDERLSSVQDALDLVSVCGEQATHRVLLHADQLDERFFDLKSGLAGEFLLKFSNYYLKVALEIPRERNYGERFAEFASETRQSREFRIFHTRDSAIEWLVME